MSQRNPMNERYTSDQKRGATRKSAASAKPVSKAASSVRTTSAKPEKKGLFGGSKKQEPAPAKAPKKTQAAQSARKAEEAPSLSKEEQKEIEKHNKQVKRADREARRERNKEVNRFVPDTAEFKRLNRKAYGLFGRWFRGHDYCHRAFAAYSSAAVHFNWPDDCFLVLLLHGYAHRHQPAASSA